MEREREEVKLKTKTLRERENGRSRGVIHTKITGQEIVLTTTNRKE